MQTGPFRGQDASGWRTARRTRLHATHDAGVCFLAAKCLREAELSFFWGGVWGKQTSDYTPGTWRRTDVHLENPEYHTRWFFKYFLGKGQCVRACAGKPAGRTSASCGGESLLCARGLPPPLWFTEPISSGQVGSSLSTVWPHPH